MGLTLVALFGLVSIFGQAPVVEDTPGQLAEMLQSTSRDKRRSAVRRLAKLNNDEAWEWVVRALSDPDGVVADEAEFRLRKLSSGPAVELLCGRAGLRSKEPAVAVSAASVLGLFDGELDSEQLSKRLKDHNGDLRFALLSAIEERAETGRLSGRRVRIVKDALALARSAKAPATRANALVAAARASDSPRERDDVARVLARAAKDREASVRVAALIASSTWGAESVEALLQTLASDSAVCVRLQVLESAKELANRNSAGVLVEMLEGETHPRVRWLLVGALQQISGLLHRADPRPWRDWLISLPEDWRGGTKPVRPPSGAASSASLAGLPILSDRIIFLVDFSGSLWTKRADGTLRKTYAEVELRKALESLPETARFNLIPFTSEPHPWKPELVRATSRNVSQALEWFEACTERGTGDFYEAALLALKDPEVDTILSFTDGLPTGGRRCRLELMVPELLKRARFRRVAFDTLLVDAPKRLHRHWQRLADESGGQLVAD